MASNQVKSTMSAEELLKLGSASEAQGPASPSSALEHLAARAEPLEINAAASGEEEAPEEFEFAKPAKALDALDTERLLVISEALGGYELMMEKARREIAPASLLNPQMDEVEAKRAVFSSMQTKCRVLRKEIAAALGPVQE